MKHFHIITNEIKDRDLAITRRLRRIIAEKGGSSCVFLCNQDGIQEQELEVDHEEHAKKGASFLEGADCVLVLGGDGTLLRAAREVSVKTLPLLGINLGTLGFLAEVETNRMDEAITRLMAGDYLTEERMMLTGNIIHEDSTKSISPALNDITIARCGSLQIIRFSIYVNHKFLCNMSADGVILATPTGSTGYNMSAGGPIAEPGAQLLILTPICAHTLNSRSIILKSDDVVEIVIGKANDGSVLTVEASSDGNEKVTMVTGDTLRICKSDKTTTIVKLDERSFLEALHRKMNE